MRLVRATTAVATPPPPAAAALPGPPPATTSSPPAAPPATTTAAITTTRRLAERTRLPRNSAIGVLTRQSAVELDRSRRGRAATREALHAGLLHAQVVGLVERGVVRVQVAPGADIHYDAAAGDGVGEVRDPVGPHALGELQRLGRGRRLAGRLAGPQRGLGRAQVCPAVLARPGVALPALVRPVEPAGDRGWHADVDQLAGGNGRIGLIRIAVPAHAGSPLVEQLGRAAPRGGRGAPAAIAAARRPPAAVPPAGDPRGAWPAAACGQPDGGRRDEGREPARPPVRPCHISPPWLVSREPLMVMHLVFLGSV